eukprot:s963_g10.t1
MLSFSADVLSHLPSMRASNKKFNRPSSAKTFLGQAVARYDVDELDDLGKRSKRESYVEVKRPDGSIAKSRGERTFYGAFEGGFSAGYWGTVGSKEGWEPASFSSSRSKRHADAAPRVEDYMDEEDLRDHRSSRKTIAARDEFASREVQARGMGSAALTTGISQDLEEELFGAQRLGTRLLRASIVPQTENDSSTPSAPSAAPKAKKSYGCAPPPAGYKPAKPEAESAQSDGGVELQQWPGKKLATLHASQAPSIERQLEAELERLWQSKTDLHGIGYFLGGGSSGCGSGIPSNRRLYMSTARAKNVSSTKAIGYSQFGTGVLDQDEYDVWEEVYEHETDKRVHYHPALKDEDVEEVRLAALDDIRPRSKEGAPEEVPGFVKAELPDKETRDFSRWHPPPVPRGYKGVHLIEVSPLQEAQEGSKEHQQLLEFQDKHGQQRLMDPAFRAQLLGEQTRPKDETEASKVAAPPGPPTEEEQQRSIQRSAEPLWQAVPEHQKQNLLNALGRNFVIGTTQDMDGKSARHEPFKNDPSKQKRYAKFCLAMEGRAAFSEALKESHGLSEVERETEIQEFGRVYRSFRQQNPDADIAKALEEKGSAQPSAPLIRRTVTPWAPDKLLCRRWGVPGNLAARAFCSIWQRGQPTTVYGLHEGILHLHCGGDLERISLHGVLDGLWSVMVWASGFASGIHFRRLSTTQKGVHIGTAAVLMVADCLLGCRVGQRVLACLHVSLDFLLSWLFLPQKNFGRKPEGALRALAGLLAANGMALLKNRSRTQQSHQVGQLLCPEHRSVFWPKTFPGLGTAARRRAVDHLVHMQLLAVRSPDMVLDSYGCSYRDGAVLYQWFGPSRYVGVASLQRSSRPGVPGPALRWWEHLLHWSRRSLKGSNLKKYTLFRRVGGSQMGFLVSRAGPSTLMLAAEQLEIRCHRPAANATAARRLTCNRRPRSRPPRSCRGYVRQHVREGAFEGTVATLQFDKAVARVHKAQHYNACRARPQDPLRELQMDFRSAYRHVQQQRFVQSGVCGPINIYSRTNWRLLLLFLATFGHRVHWACIDKHWGSACSAILLWKKAKVWLTGRRLRLAQQQVDDLLYSRRLPSTKGYTISVPQLCFIPAVKSAVRVGVSSQPLWDKVVQNYVLQSSRIVVGKVPTFADKQNCSREAQFFDWKEVRTCADSELANAVLGIGARRVETNWKVPVPTTQEDDLASVKQCLRGWCTAFLVPKASKACRGYAARRLQSTTAWRRHRRQVDEVLLSHGKILRGFQSSKQEVICPDDKVKQYKWVVPRASYFLMAAYFVSVSSAWCAVSMTVAEAQAWCAALLAVFVPERLRRQFGIMPGKWFLPYCYNSIKPKCFAHGRRCCQKEGHSCMRRIVSYVKWPARRLWRQAGRAITFLLQTSLMTDEIWALKFARRDMERKFQRLLPARQAGRCDRCHGPCADVEAITADAGQFFECVSAQKACQALDQVLRLAKCDGHSTITVIGNHVVFYGGCIFRSLRRCRVFLLDDLYWLFAAACSLRFAHTGTQVWSFTGLPIGGLLSKAAASTVLGWEEHVWNFSDEKRRAAQFWWSDRLWSHTVARGRYVDDVLWISRSLCHGCLEEGVEHAYSVPFETTVPTEDGMLMWLDFSISLPSLHWTAKRKQFVPPLPWAASKDYVFSVLSGRVARWREMQLLPEDLAVAMVCLFCDFLRAGWKKSHLRKSVFRVAQRLPTQVGKVLVAAFHSCFSRC